MGVTSIPSEILDVILENEKLSISDVMSFALTCKQIYQDVTTSNTLWKKKTLQRWEFIENVFENAEIAQVSKINWFDEMKGQFFRRTQLKEYLAEMSAKNCSKLPISYSDMKQLDALLLPDISARSTNYYLWIEALNAIRRDDKDNLSDEYYGRRILPYITQTYVTLEWQKLLALPARKQTAERGNLLLSQWMQPCRPIYAKEMSDSFDNMARLTRESIAKDHPDLLINRTTSAEEAEWKNERLDDNKWSAEDSKIIISALCETMFTRLGFESKLGGHTSMIDEALAWKVDEKISLMTIFEAVSRRLGLRFEIVNRDDDLALLRWKERYTLEGHGTVASYYLNTFFDERSLRRDSRCEAFDESPEATVLDMAEEIAYYIPYEMDVPFEEERWSCEFLHMIRPRNITYLLDLIDFYRSNGLNFGELVESLKDIPKENEWLDLDDDIKLYEKIYRRWEEVRKKQLLEPPKMRTPQVQYAVGMIVKDRRNVMSVITGWDATKNDNAKGLVERELSNLRYGDKQPFYSIYCQDNSSLYVPQETLTLAQSPQAVYHSDMGRYFRKFKGHYYLPNVATARIYPEDAELLSKLYEC